MVNRHRRREAMSQLLLALALLIIAGWLTKVAYVFIQSVRVMRRLPPMTDERYAALSEGTLALDPLEIQAGWHYCPQLQGLLCVAGEKREGQWRKLRKEARVTAIAQWRA